MIAVDTLIEARWVVPVLPRGVVLENHTVAIANGQIVAQNTEIAVAGRSARDILNTLIDMGLVSRLDHAGYLGRELERAEIALGLKRDYVQDEPLWPAEKS